MSQTEIHYHYWPNEILLKHELQIESTIITPDSITNKLNLFREIDSWLHNNKKIGYFEQSFRCGFGWLFRNKEDAILIKLTFG
jgi:hypothetical protein